MRILIPEDAGYLFRSVTSVTSDKPGVCMCVQCQSGQFIGSQIMSKLPFIDRGLEEYIHAPLENPDDSLISTLICWSSDLEDDADQTDSAEVDFDRQPAHSDECLQQENLIAARELMIPSRQVERSPKRAASIQPNLPEVCSPRKPKSLIDPAVAATPAIKTEVRSPPKPKTLANQTSTPKTKVYPPLDIRITTDTTEAKTSSPSKRFHTVRNAGFL